MACCPRLLLTCASSGDVIAFEGVVTATRVFWPVWQLCHTLPPENLLEGTDGFNPPATSRVRWPAALAFC